jgi:predicted membrane channel-forming protein YqfA (hemolysin III family)
MLLASHTPILLELLGPRLMWAIAKTVILLGLVGFLKTLFTLGARVRGRRTSE